MARPDFTCPHCKAIIKRKVAHLCPECGIALDEEGKRILQDMIVTAKAADKKGNVIMKRLRSIIHSLILLVVILSMLVSCASSSTSPTTPKTLNLVSVAATVSPTPIATLAPTATPIAPTPTAVATESPAPAATTTPAAFIEVDGETVETFVSTAIALDGKYTLHDSDMNKIDVNLSQAIGFVPDEDLLVSDLKTETLGQDPVSLTQNWDEYLNKINDPYAGFTSSINDYNQYYLHQAKPQIPEYSWMVHTGFYVEMPGIGRVTGEKGRAVMILVLNRANSVYRYRAEPITVIAGFQAFGRIWNGDEKPLMETEKRITNHYLTRLGSGVPEKGFIGQTDRTDNAITVTVVTVERLQWGNEINGDPRYQFRLLRAETVPAIKDGTTLTPSPTASPSPSPTIAPTPAPTTAPAAAPASTPKPTAKPTPKPTATPKPTSTPAPTQTPAPTKNLGWKTGETKSLLPGHSCLGDVVVLGHEKYDKNGSKEATIVVNLSTAPISIFAEWSAGEKISTDIKTLVNSEFDKKDTNGQLSFTQVRLVLITQPNIVPEKDTIYTTKITDPTPAPTPSPSPTPTPAPTTVNYQIPKGIEYVCPADGVIAADCILNGVPLHDSKENTFLVFSVKKGDKVISPFGIGWLETKLTLQELKTKVQTSNPTWVPQP